MQEFVWTGKQMLLQINHFFLLLWFQGKGISAKDTFVQVKGKGKTALGEKL